MTTPGREISFDISPEWAVAPWLAAVLLGLVWLHRRSGPSLPRSKCAILWGLRGGVLAGLIAIGLNPVHVTVIPGTLNRPEVHVLLDASQSMRLGSPTTRWDESLTMLRAALEGQNEHADVRVHRFGESLVAVNAGALHEAGTLGPPDDADTQLAGAFRQLTGRLGRDAPAAIVVLSDGRIRNPEKLEEMAADWRRRQVPVHVLPVGQAAAGGDVAIIAAVAPAKARKQSQVQINVFLRSFGFAGRRSELQLQALDDSGAYRRTLTSLPVTLQDGVQPLTVAFRTELDQKRLRLHVPPPPGDLTAANNDFPLEIEIDRTKIRVLLLDGSADPTFSPRTPVPVGADLFDDSAAPYAPVRDALLADPDVQCTVYYVTPDGEPIRVPTRETAHLGPAFPRTAAELLAYDALVLSNVPSDCLSEEVLRWVEEWIGKRGGGLLMAGGPRSFGAGGWNGTVIERMLPVEFSNESDWDATPAIVEPTGAELHPIWRLFEDERAARAALRILPESVGRNNWVRVKPQSGTLLGAQKAGTGSGTPPLLAVGAYGRGRTIALATPLSAPWAPRFTRQWGEGEDNKYFARFVRNAIYWLTEDSAIGRRRLVASTDKRYYRPGETVAIAAQTFDESANRTGRYRVVAMLEPKQFDGAELPPCPVKWPAGKPRTSGETGALAGWGEEIELNLDPETKQHVLALPLTEMLANGLAGQAFKLELTAYEGPTQIDSSSLDVQVLSDPHEQQNPLPNREFLESLAQSTGGSVLTSGAELGDLIAGLPIAEGPQTVRRTPLWSNEWFLGSLIALLAFEWFARRWLGLA